MIADKACAERGCACYSPQFGDTDGVEMIRKEWVGLTDDDYKELHLQMGPTYFYQEYGHAIEAKLKELNT